jgi:hypothetical protein
VCSLSWREPKLAKRPLVATVAVISPYQVLTRPMTLKPKTAEASAGDPAAAGPVAWWKFDERDGASAADASGHRLEARLQGLARWAPSQGRFGGALELSGNTRDFADGGDAEAFDFRDALAVSAWVKVRQFNQPAQVLLGKGKNAWALRRHGDDGSLEFALTGPQLTGPKKGRPPVVRSNRRVDDGQWHHVVAQYDGKQASVYLDGVLEGSVKAGGPIAQNTEAVWLGENASARGRAFNGWLDDVRLYGRSLKAEEIQDLFRGESAAVGAGAK